MCLIIAQDIGIRTDSMQAIEATLYNQDGLGFALLDRGRVYIAKDVTEDDLMEVIDATEHDRIVHFRLATHGSKDASQCHPFRLSCGAALAHNGILSRPFDGDSVRSDTAHFVDWANANLKPRWYEDKETRLAIGSLIGYGNKMTVLSDSGLYIINEHEGLYCSYGAWYSNDNYCDVPGNKKSKVAQWPGTTSRWDDDLRKWDMDAETEEPYLSFSDVHLCDCGGHFYEGSPCSFCGNFTAVRSSK